MDLSKQPEHDSEHSLTPINFLFPEVSTEEASTLDAETLLLAERRAKVAYLYARRTPMRQIAEEVKTTIRTVYRDINVVLSNYYKHSMQSAQALIADELRRRAHREAEVEADLERSRGEFTEVTTGKRGNEKGSHENATVKRRTKYGDPRLHAILQGYGRDRMKLLGLLRDMGGTAVEPEVKYVSGIDPMELV